jgi:hypothetical protein
MKHQFSMLVAEHGVLCICISKASLAKVFSKPLHLNYYLGKEVFKYNSLCASVIKASRSALQ